MNIEIARKRYMDVIRPDVMHNTQGDFLATHVPTSHTTAPPIFSVTGGKDRSGISPRCGTAATRSAGLTMDSSMTMTCLATLGFPQSVPTRSSTTKSARPGCGS